MNILFPNENYRLWARILIVLVAFLASIFSGQLLKSESGAYLFEPCIKGKISMNSPIKLNENIRSYRPEHSIPAYHISPSNFMLAPLGVAKTHTQKCTPSRKQWKKGKNADYQSNMKRAQLMSISYLKWALWCEYQISLCVPVFVCCKKLFQTIKPRSRWGEKEQEREKWNY